MDKKLNPNHFFLNYKLKWVAYGTAFIMALLLTLHFTIKFKLKKGLQEAIFESSKGLYELRIEEISYNLFTGSTQLNHIELNYNISKVKQLKDEAIPSNLFKLKIK